MGAEHPFERREGASVFCLRLLGLAELDENGREIAARLRDIGVIGPLRLLAKGEDATSTAWCRA